MKKEFVPSKIVEDRRIRREKYIRDVLPNELALLVRLDGVTFLVNDGDHLILTVKVDRRVARTVDYWPLRGYWRVRNGKGKGWRIGRLRNYFKLKLKAVRYGDEEEAGGHESRGADPGSPCDEAGSPARDGDAPG